MSREEREEAYNKARERIFGTATEVSSPGMSYNKLHMIFQVDKLN